MIEIDGSFLSGGGQILRTAMALSVVTEKPCQIFNIRKNRPKPGLAHQHLLGIQALAKLCDGRLERDFIGSENIEFYPGQTSRKQISITIPTAGSVTSILQTLLPAALLTSFPIEISIEGGATDTFFSPTIDHFQYVFLKNLEKMLTPLNSEGICSGEGNAEINILRHGYYPEGGAKVLANIYPSKLKNLSLIERGNLKKILAISGTSETLKDKKVAERQMAGIREILGKLKLPIEEKIEYYDTLCPGSQVCLIAEFANSIIGVDNLGKLGKRAEDVGREAALDLLKEEKSGACLDKHMADQILPYMALAPCQSETFGSGFAERKSQATVSEITDHCRANMWVIEKFLDGRFETKENLITWLPKN